MLTRDQSLFLSIISARSAGWLAGGVSAQMTMEEERTMPYVTSPGPDTKAIVVGGDRHQVPTDISHMGFSPLSTAIIANPHPYFSLQLTCFFSLPCDTLRTYTYLGIYMLMPKSELCELVLTESMLDATSPGD